MKKIILTLVLVNSLLLSGEKSYNPEYNEYVSDVYFANGIDTDKGDAQKSIDYVKQQYKKSYSQSSQSILNWQVSYNHTHGIGIDLYESMLQKIYEDSPGKSFLPFLWNFDEVFGHLNITFKQIVERISKKIPKNAVKEYASKAAKRIAKDTVQYFNRKYVKNFTEEQIELMFNNIFDHIIEESIGSFIDISEENIIAQESADVNTHFLKYNQSIKDGHGVIVIAHSQGNLFTNRVYNEFGVFNNIRKDAWMKKYISAIGVASPANNILGKKSPYMTFNNDMIQLIPDSLPAIEPNPHRYYFENGVGENIETLYSVEAHSFMTSYMEEKSITKDKILGFINEKVLEQRDDTDKRPSQWKVEKKLGCICKTKYAKMTHIYESDSMNKYLANEKVKDFAEGALGKIYRADTGEHSEYVRALDGDKSKDGVFTIEPLEEEGVCYVLKDDTSTVLGKVKRRTEPLPEPKPGAVQVTLTWENPAINFDLDVKWDAGEHDVQDTGCTMEHFYVATQYDIYPGTYPIYVNYNKEEDNESVLIPEKMKMIITVPGKPTEIYDIDINSTGELEVGHVADIHVEYIDGEIVPTIQPEPVPYIRPIRIPQYDRPSSGGGGGSGGGVSYGGSSGHHVYIPNLPSCQESCGCLPCEYTIIPYLEQLLYGPLSGADLALYEAVYYANKTAIYTGKTASGNTLYTAGNIEIPDEIVSTLDDDTLYLLVANGGVDLDHDDDMKIDAVPTVNSGETHLLLTGKDIKEIGFKANVLTEIAYQIVKDMVDINSTQEVQNKLNEVVQRLLTHKIYNDVNNTLSYKDLSFWLPTVHKTLLVPDYEEKIAPFVEQVFANQDVGDQAYTIVYPIDNKVPILQIQRYDIDENISNATKVGDISVLSEGTTAIEGFELTGNGSENFVVDSDGGLYVAENASLDYEQRTYYDFYAVATNAQGRSKDTQIIVQLHNVSDAPEMTSYQATTLFTDTAVDTEVFRFDFNSGSSALQTAVLSGIGNEYFKTEIVDNVVIIKIAQSLLNYTSKRAYTLTIRVSNETESSRSIPFPLLVGDRRDIPSLKNTTLYVDENVTIGTTIGKMTVLSDGDRAITDFKMRAQYDWQCPKDYFSIDIDGTIRVDENTTLDYENRTEYICYIKAKNSVGKSSEVYLKIRLNNIADTLPTCQTTTLELGPIAKAISIGTSVIKNGSVGCYAGDSAYVSAILEPASPFEAVIATNHNGYENVDIRLASSLENVDVSEYNLSLSVTNATGESNKSPVHITIDSNDYIFDMFEGDPNKVIGQINLEGKEILYVNDDNRYFDIDTNGTIRRNNRGEYVFTPQHVYTITVTHPDYTTEKISVVINVKSRIVSILNTPGIVKKVVLNQTKTRAYLADYDHGLHIVDISDVNNTRIIASLDTSGAANDLVLSLDEKYVYLLDVGQGLKIVDVSDENNPQLVSTVSIGSYSYNVVLSPDGNYAYASHGRSGIEVIDISNPLSPEIVKNIGFLGTLENGGNNYSYKDVPSGGYRSIVSDGTILYSVDWNYGLQIIDINDLENPVSIYSEVLRGSDSSGKYGHSAEYIYVNEEKGLISVVSTNDTPMSLYHFENGKAISKLTLEYSNSNIELFDENIAYSAHYGLNVYNAYNLTNMTKILDLNLGKTHGLTLDKKRNIAFIANGEKGLTLVDLTGIEQPIQYEPVIAGTTINLAEENLSSITMDDVLGNVSILKIGNTPIVKMWTDQPKYKSGGLDCGYTYYAPPIDKNCEYDYSYFDVDENGKIYISDTTSLAYENIGNMVPFGVYAENESGHKSSQGKVMLKIIENPDWSLKFQRSVIVIDDNVPVGTEIANVMLRESERELFSIGVYESDGSSCNESSLARCTVSEYFSVSENGSVSIINRPPNGTYQVHIIAFDRFGTRFLSNQMIEVKNVVPILGESSFSIEENATVGTVVGSLNVVSMGISDITHFNINASEYFSIDTNGTMRLEKSVDYETATLHTFEVTAFNSIGESFPVDMTINIIDIIDEIPILSDLNTTIDENAIGGTVVGTLAIVNNGDSPISQINLFGEGAEKFSVSPLGVIMVESNVTLDYESKHIYDLTAMAINQAGQGNSATVTIVLKDIGKIIINDFTGIVNENTLRGTIIGSIIEEIEKDIGGYDLKITYIDNNTFNIDRNGMIRVNTTLDYETKKDYMLSVLVSNKNEKDKAVTINISVLNVIDNPPRLEHAQDIFLPATVNAGSVITKVQTNGLIEDENQVDGYHIVSGNDNEDFMIDAEGLISTINPLYAQTKSVYHLEIEAYNKASVSQTVKVNITLESSPKIPEQVAKFSVDGNPGYGHFAKELTIMDESVLGEVSYEDTGIYVYAKDEKGIFSLSNKILSDVYSSSFANSLASSDVWLLVGDKTGNTKINGGGIAYLYKKEPNNMFRHISTIEADDIKDYDAFGDTVKIDGDLMAIANDENSVYIYKREDNNTVTFLSKITTPDGVKNNWFGWNIEISNNFIAISAEGDDVTGKNTGAVYLYKREVDDTIVFLEKVYKFGNNTSTFFGQSIALNDKLLAISSDQSVYLFKRSTEDKIEHFSIMLNPSEDKNTSRFGHALALSNTQLAISAYHEKVDNKDDVGVVYLYQVGENENDTVTFIAKLEPHEKDEWGEFGTSLAISDRLLAIGAKGNSVNHYSNWVGEDGGLGRIYIFELNLSNPLYFYERNPLPLRTVTNYVGLLHTVDSSSLLGEILTYSIEGEDGNFFSMQDNGLYQSVELDENIPLDENRDNHYVFTIVVEDNSSNSMSLDVNLSIGR